MECGFAIDLNPLKGFIQFGNYDFATAHLYTFLVQVNNSFMFIVYVETNWSRLKKWAF